MTETYTYDAFGTLTYIQSLNEDGVLAQTDTALSRFLYAGEQYDEVTGLYYLRARSYDTTVGRFTQEDTYLGDGRNLYVYVQNNPLKYVDPSGYSKDTGYRAKNNFWNAILQGAVISSQMADSYSGQVGKDWGNHIAPTVQEDPKGSARDLAIGVIDSISPIPTGLDRYVEHQDLYMTGAIFTMAFGGGFDDAVESVAKTASKMDEIADTVEAVTDLSKSNLDELALSGVTAASKKGNYSASIQNISRDDIIKTLEGVTEQSTDIANGLKSGEIKLNVLGDDLFETYLGVSSDTVAMQVGNQIYVRGGSSTLLSDIVHEGTHALDYVDGLDEIIISSWSGEIRAYSAERLFQKQSGMLLDFLSEEDMLVHIWRNYNR